MVLLPPRPYRLKAEVEILESISGGAFIWWRRQHLEFVPADPYARFVMPFPPEARTTEYFVVSFLDAQGIRTLLGFPVSDEAYDVWLKRSRGGDARRLVKAT